MIFSRYFVIFIIRQAQNERAKECKIERAREGDRERVKNTMRCMQHSIAKGIK